MAAEFLRRWNEEELVETRHLIGEFRTPQELAAALEHVGAFDFELIELLLGRRLIERYEMWKPAINWMGDSMGDDVYPTFGALVERMRRTLAVSGSAAGES